MFERREGRKEDLEISLGQGELAMHFGRDCRYNLTEESVVDKIEEQEASVS